MGDQGTAEKGRKATGNGCDAETRKNVDGCLRRF